MALLSRNSISVVFPAYNEALCIALAVNQGRETLGRLAEDWEIIVVNDGSADDTGKIIDAMSRADARIKSVHHNGNKGYGAALKSGFAKATKDLVFFCDSDLQFHISELITQLVWIEQYDIVIGYREKRQDSPHRIFNAWAWNQLVRATLGLKVRDIDCAFKLFRSYVFDYIDIESVGAMVNTEILTQAFRMGFTVKELPVTHFPREAGKQTGANLRVIAKAFRELNRLAKKLRNVDRIIHNGPLGASPQEPRESCRRRALLPINFEDRRQRYAVDEKGAHPLAISGAASHGTASHWGAGRQ